MGKQSAPKPPDPQEVARAQTGTNVSTSVANTAMGQVDQVTPYGSLTYEQTGRNFIPSDDGQTYWVGPDGQVRSSAPMRTVTTGGPTQPREIGDFFRRDRTTASETQEAPLEGWTKQRGMYVPQYTARTELTPEQQAIFDTSQETQGTLANIGKEQSGRIRDLLSTPVNLDNEATESRLYELGSKRLDPRFEREGESLRSRLASQGLEEGSAAWDSAMTRHGESKNDAYNELLLRGRGQAIQEALTERNQPINEITALLGNSQIQAPNFSIAQPSQMPTVDRAGLEMQSYNQNLSRWQQRQQQAQQLWGGLMGLGGSALTGAGAAGGFGSLFGYA